MKKIFLLFMVCVTVVTLDAQVFTEYFDTATVGNDLEGYNEWYVSFKDDDALGVSPVISGEFPLFYDGYIGSDTGKVVELDSLVGMISDTQRASTKVITFAPGDTMRPVIGGKMYAAFMVSIGANSKNSWRDFFTWEGSNYTSLWARGRIFVNVADNDADLQFGISKNSSSSIAESELLVGGVGQYHLLVLVYEAVDGSTSNDVISLYVNPDPTKTEAEQTGTLLINFDSNSDYSEGTEMKFNLRQRGIGALISGIRIGRDWDQVLNGKGDPTGVVEPDAASGNIRSYGNTIITAGSGFLQVFDISGRKVMDGICTGRTETSLRSGIYIVRFEDNKGIVYTGKVSLTR